MGKWNFVESLKCAVKLSCVSVHLLLKVFSEGNVVRYDLGLLWDIGW